MREKALLSIIRVEQERNAMLTHTLKERNARISQLETLLQDFTATLSELGSNPTLKNYKSVIDMTSYDSPIFAHKYMLCDNRTTECRELYVNGELIAAIHSSMIKELHKPAMFNILHSTEWLRYPDKPQ